MKNANIITYDNTINDYRIGGKSLLKHLEKHEGVRAKSHLPAIVSQFNTIERLAGLAPPDLIEDHVAIYLCGRCGGYDGSPIGVKVEISETSVTWATMGYYSDGEEDDFHAFDKVSSFTFELNQYRDFLKMLETHAVTKQGK